MIVEVHGRHARGKDVQHPHGYYSTIQPVLLMERTITHIWTIRSCLGLEREREQTMKAVQCLKYMFYFNYTSFAVAILCLLFYV